MGILGDFMMLNIMILVDEVGGMFGIIILDDGMILNFFEIENIICFMLDI